MRLLGPRRDRTGVADPERELLLDELPDFERSDLGRPEAHVWQGLADGGREFPVRGLDDLERGRVGKAGRIDDVLRRNKPHDVGLEQLERIGRRGAVARAYDRRVHVDDAEHGILAPGGWRRRSRGLFHNGGVLCATDRLVRNRRARLAHHARAISRLRSDTWSRDFHVPHYLVALAGRSRRLVRRWDV